LIRTLQNLLIDGFNLEFLLDYNLDKSLINKKGLQFGDLFFGGMKHSISEKRYEKSYLNDSGLISYVVIRSLNQKFYVVHLQLDFSPLT
jgi:hypothetical protein